METTTSIGNIAASATRIATDGTSKVAGLIHSMPTPSSDITSKNPIANPSEFQPFHAFDPSVFEKPPREFGNIDIFRDTVEVASSRPKPIQEPSFDFVDFNFLFTQAHTPNPVLPNLNSQGSAAIPQPEGIENDSSFKFDLGELSLPEVPAVNIQIKPSAIPEPFEDVDFEDLLADPADDQEVLEDAPEETDPVIIIEEASDPESSQIAEDSQEENDETEDEIDESDDETEAVLGEIDPSRPPIEGHPDIMKAQKPKFFVDFEAVQARIENARRSVKSIDPTQEEISGKRISYLMNQTPSLEETSEVLALIPTYRDGSYSEILEDISELSFSTKGEAMVKIMELIRNKPAIMIAKFGKAVNEFDVSRVFKFLDMSQNPATTGLNPTTT